MQTDYQNEEAVSFRAGANNVTVKVTVNEKPGAKRILSQKE